MEYTYFCGWDISKQTLDFNLINSGGEQLHAGRIANKAKAIKQLFKELEELIETPSAKVLHCAENTGAYSNHLAYTADEFEIPFWLEDPLQIKSSSGRQKDKTDAVDAHLIALYAYRFADRAKLWNKPDSLLAQLRFVQGQRNLLVETRKRIRTSLNQQKAHFVQELDQATVAIVEQQVEQLTESIQHIEKRIDDLIKQNDEVQRMREIAESVSGIGPKTAIVLLIETGFFKRVDSAKKCASFSGVSPHRHESGSSIRHRHRTSRASNSTIRTALTMGGRSLLRKDSIFKRLYERLRQKGKTHLQALNAVRNKMIKVLYACIRDNVMYCKNLHENLQIS